MMDSYNSADIAYFHRQARHNLKMAQAFRGHAMHRHTRVIYQERAADYRECIIDQYRRRAGWTLAERARRWEAFPAICSAPMMGEFSITSATRL